jgi:hypothetical protein
MWVTTLGSRSLWQFTEMGGETVEMMFPEMPVRFEPVRRVSHRGGGEADVPYTSVAPALNEARALQYHEVLADCG